MDAPSGPNNVPTDLYYIETRTRDKYGCAEVVLIPVWYNMPKGPKLIDEYDATSPVIEKK